MFDWLRKIFAKEIVLEDLIPFSPINDALSPIERGNKAKELLENPVFNEAINTLEIAAIKVWEETKVGEVKEREFIFQHIKALKQIKDIINRYANELLLERRMKENKEKK
jgi:hypothetical protein